MYLDTGLMIIGYQDLRRYEVAMTAGSTKSLTVMPPATVMLQTL